MYAVPTVSPAPLRSKPVHLSYSQVEELSAASYRPSSHLTISSIVFIMCLPWCCWPFVDVELEEPPKKKKEEDKRYIMVEDGSLFYPVS